MADEQENRKTFSIQKIYLKDSSFESPGAPGTFGFQQWDPQVELNLNNSHGKVGDDLYEAVLRITATVSQGDSTAFLIEVQQAGLFAINGFDEAERNYLLGSQCMTVLFPYAREAISEMAVRGGFPPLILSPVNFDALYQQHRQQKAQKESAGADD